MIDGKPATATHFSLDGKSGSATAIAPVKVPENTNWQKPVTPVQAKQPGGEKAVVTYVEDGDSARLNRKDGSGINCRIDTIDAPETAHKKGNKPAQAFGEEAKRKLEAMIANKEVTLTVTKAADTGPASKENNYSRALCKIEIEGKNVDLAMIQAGAAWVYKKYGTSPDATLVNAENTARLKKEGLWADPAAENPARFRRRVNTP